MHGDMLRPIALPRLARIAVLVAWAAVLGACGSSGAVHTDPEAVEYGAVRQGEVRLTRIRLVNAGPTDVTFQAHVTCACFALGGGYRNVLGPGETLDLQVRFDSKDQPAGRLEKALEIHTNEEGGRVLSVPLRADIVRVLDVSGATVGLKHLDGGPQDLVPRTVEFRPTQGYTVEVEKVEPLGTDSAHLLFTVQPPTPAGVVHLDVAVRPEAQRAIGMFVAGASVHLRLTAPDGSSFSMQQTVKVEGFWARSQPR